MTHLQKDTATKTNHCLHLYCLSCVLPEHDLEHTNVFLRIHNQILSTKHEIVFQKARVKKCLKKIRRNEISNIIDYEKKV